jgi:hypothetical protein
MREKKADPEPVKEVEPGKNRRAKASPSTTSGANSHTVPSKSFSSREQSEVCSDSI